MVVDHPVEDALEDGQLVTHVDGRLELLVEFRRNFGALSVTLAIAESALAGPLEAHGHVNCQNGKNWPRYFATI